MQNVTNFINLLGENYYLDFIIEPYKEEVDYEQHYILIEYQNKYYYELQLDLIKIKQSDIINKVKEFYEKSLSDLYIEVSKLKKDEIEKYLNFHIQAIKLKMNTLKDDFYIYENKSRYFSIFIDQFETISIDRKRNKKDLSDYFDYGSEIYNVFRRIDPDSYLYNINETESIYEIEDHCKRQVCLSILPFKLFQIGQHFIFEIEKIKLMNKEEIKIDTTNSSSQSKIKENYFDKFCELIDDINVLDKYTAIGVMIDLKECIKEIKSETLKELQEKGVNRNDHLEFKINEVEKRSYSKYADISYIKRWIDEYEVSLTGIINNSFQGNPIALMLDQHYKDLEKFSPERDKAYNIQLDFYQYFCKLYADELIIYFNSKKELKQTNVNIPTKQQPSMKPFKDEYLNAFCKEISNVSDIYECTFIQCYDFGIKNYTEFLKSEITENLLILPAEKIKPYLDFVEDKIKKTPYFEVEKNIVDRWISEYDLKKTEFPYKENIEVKQLISTSVKFEQLTVEDRALMEDIQTDFYCYAAMIEANKMIDFLQSKKSNSDGNIIETENANQLSVNQAVILLDKLGVFTDKAFENVPNTKKAKLISQLLGKNEKNIKTSIEKLELKKSELGAGYQRDLDKIQQLLNNLE